MFYWVPYCKATLVKNRSSATAYLRPKFAVANLQRICEGLNLRREFCDRICGHKFVTDLRQIYDRLIFVTRFTTAILQPEIRMQIRSQKHLQPEFRLQIWLHKQI